MVIAERQKYPQIGNIYQMVVSRVKEAARRIVRPHLRCVTGEAQDFLAEMFFAIVVADTQMAFLTGTADDQLAQERGRWITRHLATRSEERRVGKECVSTGRKRGSPD